jgi:hypothetical protein
MEGAGTLPEAVLAADVVEVAAGPGPAIRTARRATARPVPRWEAEGRNRVRAAARALAGPLAGLAARDADEDDTRLLVTGFLRDGLGYSQHDLAAEYQVRDEFAGYGVRIAHRLVAFIEVKRAAAGLSPQHLRRAQTHAASEGAEWVLLTNGRVWQAWHLTAGPPAVLDMVLEADLLGGDGPAPADALFHLSKEAFKHHVIDGLWRVRAATSATSLGTVITSDPVIGQIRKELRRRTGHDVDPAELSDLIRSSVLRAPDTRRRARRPTTVVCGIPVGRMEDLAG